MSPVPTLRSHDARCVLDPMHHAATPCSWFVAPAPATQDAILAARLHDLLDNDEEFAEMYRDAQAEQRAGWTYESVPLFDSEAAA